MESVRLLALMAAEYRRLASVLADRDPVRAAEHTEMATAYEHGAATAAARRALDIETLRQMFGRESQ